MADDGRGLRRLAFYMVPTADGCRVVQLRNATETTVCVVEPETGTRWTLNREPFECRLRERSITEVVPNWEPAGDVVVA